MFIDFASLKERVSILDLVKHFDLQVHALENGQLRGSCPTCDKEKGGRSLVITPGKNLFFCFKEKAGGDVINLTRHVKGIGVKEAGKYLAETFAPTQPKKEEEAVKPYRTEPLDPLPPHKEEPKGFNPEEYISKLDTSHDLVKKAGVSEELCHRIGMGVAKKGVNAGKLAFPLYDRAGNFLFFASSTDFTLPKNWRAT